MPLPNSLLMRDGAFLVRNGGLVVTDASGNSCCCGCSCPGTGISRPDCCCLPPTDPNYCGSSAACECATCVCRNGLGAITGFLPPCCCPPPMGTGTCIGSALCNCNPTPNCTGCSAFYDPSLLSLSATASGDYTQNGCRTCPNGSNNVVLFNQAGGGGSSSGNGNFISGFSRNIGVNGTSCLSGQPCPTMVCGQAQFNMTVSGRLGCIGSSIGEIFGTIRAISNHTGTVRPGQTCQPSTNATCSGQMACIQLPGLAQFCYSFVASVQATETGQCGGAPFTTIQSSATGSASLLPFHLCGSVSDEQGPFIRPAPKRGFVALDGGLLVPSGSVEAPCSGCLEGLVRA